MSGRTNAARELRRRPRVIEQAPAKELSSWVGGGLLWSLRRGVGFVVGYAVLGLAIFGVFRDLRYSSLPQLLALAGLTALLLARLVERVQGATPEGRKPTLWSELELGTLCVSAAFVLIELTGGPDGLLYPLVYALIAFLVAFHRLTVAAYFLALIVGTEAGIVALSETHDWRLFASHASFVVLFGFLYSLFLRTEVAERRRVMEREIASHITKIDQEAEDFRLTASLSVESRDLSPDELSGRRRVSSVKAIHESLYNVLAVAERALDPHTVALLWLDPTGQHLRIKELRSRSDEVTEKPLSAGEGFLGAITKRREPLVLSSLRAGHTGLAYYEKPQLVTDFAGVPVLENGHLRGVLIADRTSGTPFSETDVTVLNTMAGEVLRVVQVERILAEMDREKYQRERFYQASRDFNAALSLEQVAQTALRVARRIAECEFAAVTVATDDEGILRIAAAEKGPVQGDIVGKTFRAEEGLVGAAIKARHPLPHGTALGPSQRLFDNAIDAPLDFVKVLPLLWKDVGVGAIVIGGPRAQFLPHDVVDMLRVVADHAAIAIANAQMYERMERMATTDGLTGLINHRHFQGMFDDMLARAERYKKPCSLILTDIDHFKSVNDTYGHPVGDRVLKVVARILGENARRVDVVARYGGEEFAVLMEQTDRRSALVIAERIRNAVAAEVLRSDNGTFSCTLSLGIATFPEDAGQKPKLLEAADQALYHAKRNGRNRSIEFATLSGKAASSA